ncbi:MAG: response regulator [Chloroflexi bacterium]|nr:response regulator [Chloroflexota bacterium]
MTQPHHPDLSLAGLLSRLERLQADFALVTDLFSTFSRTLEPVAISLEVARVVWDLTGAARVRVSYQGEQDLWQSVTLADGREDRVAWAAGALTTRLAAEQEPVCLKSVTGIPEVGSYLGVPLVFEGVLTGTLEAADLPETHRLDDTMRVLQFVAGMAAVAFNNARLLTLAQEEHRRLEAVVDGSPAGILVTDAGGNIVLQNREVQHLYRRAYSRLDEFERAAVVRRADGRLWLPEEQPLQHALRRGEPVALEELHYEFPDGRKLTQLVSARPICSSDGKVSGVIAILQDMGPLEQAERRRSEFLGMVSHELRSPLTAIKGAAAMALSSRMGKDSETLELLQVIDQQADKLRDLVNNLLDITRIEAGILSISATPTDFRAVVEEAVGTFIRGGAPQQVQVRLPDSLPRVQADGRRVAQVLTNLLSNASKFCPPSFPIALEAQSDASHVAVHVRDRGRGIPPDKLPLLFKKFSQVHEDSGRALAGTGLGLAICKGIVEAHGGRIWAESGGVGQGATFGFTLPVATVVPLVAPVDASGGAERVGRPNGTTQRARIVSVDDDPQVLRYIRRSLEEAGYQAVVTGDPDHCLKLVEEQRPDLMILDFVLPGVSGIDLLGRIRQVSAAPVIFLTGTDQGENMVRALKAGADDYITKPFSPSELLARIEVVLRRRQGPPQM